MRAGISFWNGVQGHLVAPELDARLGEGLSEVESVVKLFCDLVAEAPRLARYAFLRLSSSAKLVNGVMGFPSVFHVADRLN